ncbi:MAG: PKD domain-containing protein, partial [Bacteroidota bacterium]
MNVFKTTPAPQFVREWFAALLLVLGVAPLLATGIRDVAPTAADAPVMLETGRAGFGSFADFESAPDRRLIVSVGRADEVVYFGLAPEYRNSGRPFSDPNDARYRFRIRQITTDGSNPTVHGPFIISNTNANVRSYDDAAFGVYDTTLLIGGNQVYVFRPGITGDFSIEFDDISGDGSAQVNIPFWDVTVIRDQQPVPGRLWSRGWALRLPEVDGNNLPECEWDREFNGKFFSYTEDGFVSLIDFQDAGFQGLSFNIAFNSAGPGQTGDLALDRMSIPNFNAIENSTQHRIFLDTPDLELFPDGICGEVTAGESFTCSETQPYCLDVSVTRPGQVEILLDFNGNGVIDDNSRDIALLYEFTEGDLATCVPWDGIRGDGSPVDFTDTVDVIISYSQGVQHWSAFDVEYMRNGFCVQTIRPVCPQAIESSELYWDDRNITEEPGTGASRDGRSGNDCEESPRSWDNFNVNSANCNTVEDDETTGYGDKSTLNTWWFANSRSQFRARVPVVNATIQGPTNLCSGDATTLTAMDASLMGTPQFLWSGPGVDSLTTESVTVSVAGEYCVVISEENGCSNETCVTLTILDFDSNQFPDASSICFGDTVRLDSGGDPNFTYEWSPATGISSTTSNQPVFFPETTTTYSVRIVNQGDNGALCETTETFTVTVAPDINLQVAGGGPICDATTTFTASTNVPADVTLFDPSGTAIGMGTEFTVPVSGETDYLLVAEAPNGCTDTIVFNVSGGPVDVAVPDTVLNCASDGITVGATNLDANDELSYTWAPASLFDPATINAATPTFIGGPGEYAVSVTVTNQYNCETTEEVTIVLIDDTGELAFDAAVDCDGETVRFTNNSTVDFGFVYNFGDGTTSTDASPTHVYATPGTYTVTLDLVYDDQTCLTSFTQEVTTFEAVLEADLSATLGDCDNGTTTISFADNSLNATGADLTYAWIFTGALPATSDAENPTVTVTESGTVGARLIVSSADGCQSQLDTNITVNLAVVNLSEEIIICPGEEAALNAGALDGLTYTWSPAPDFDPNEPNPVTGTPGTYVVTVTSDAAALNCENVDTVTLIVADPIGLTVNGPNGPITGEPGEIELPTQQTCGDPIDLTVDLAVDNDVTVVYTDLDGNVLGNGNTFTVNPTGRDTIVITATDQFGCPEVDTVVIINNQVDAGIDVGAEGFNFCSATDTVVTVMNFDPDDELTYAWEANDIIQGDLDGPTVDIISQAEGTVELTVMVTNQFGCDTTITVPIVATPFTPNQYEDAIQPCYDDGFMVSGGAAVEGYVYEWEPSDNLDLTDPANPIGFFTEDGDLTVTITDPATGCSSKQTIAVDVAPEISFMAAPADTALCEPGTVMVTGSTVNANAEIVWFDDEALTNQVGTGESYVVDAAEIGQMYTIFGRATDPTTGCEQVVPVTVTVSELTAGLPLDALVACPGESPSIFGEAGPSGNLTYVYEPANVIDDSDPSAPVFVGNESTTVTVAVTHVATGCTATETVDVTVVDFGGLNGSADPEDILLGESSTLTVTGCEGDDCT